MIRNIATASKTISMNGKSYVANVGKGLTDRFISVDFIFCRV